MGARMPRLRTHAAHAHTQKSGLLYATPIGFLRADTAAFDLAHTLAFEQAKARASSGTHQQADARDMNPRTSHECPHSQQSRALK
eukprot:6199214-Pleurochrysis_carterae.AAC.2